MQITTEGLCQTLGYEGALSRNGFGLFRLMSADDAFPSRQMRGGIICSAGCALHQLSHCNHALISPKSARSFFSGADLIHSLLTLMSLLPRQNRT